MAKRYWKNVDNSLKLNWIKNVVWYNKKGELMDNLYSEEIFEKCISKYLEEDLKRLKEWIKNQVSYLDFLINELQGSVNSAFVDGDITEKQCDYFYRKYIYGIKL